MTLSINSAFPPLDGGIRGSTDWSLSAAVFATPLLVLDVLVTIAMMLVVIPGTVAVAAIRFASDARAKARRRSRRLAVS